MNCLFSTCRLTLTPGGWSATRKLLLAGKWTNCRLFVEVNYAGPPGRDAFLSKIFRNNPQHATSCMTFNDLYGVWSKNLSCPLPNARTSRQAQVNDKSG